MEKALLGYKQDVLIWGQTGCPYWETNKMSLLGDKQVALIGGQTGCPYWGTNRLPISVSLMKDILVFPYKEHISLLTDKLI